LRNYPASYPVERKLLSGHQVWKTSSITESRLNPFHEREGCLVPLNRVSARTERAVPAQRHSDNLELCTETAHQLAEHTFGPIHSQSSAHIVRYDVHSRRSAILGIRHIGRSLEGLRWGLFIPIERFAGNSLSAPDLCSRHAVLISHVSNTCSVHGDGYLQPFLTR